VSEATRVLTWKQGDVLTDESVLELELCSKEEIGSKYFVVVSHDCDLTADAIKEPYVEIVAAVLIKKLGANSNSKNARKLDLELQNGTSPMFLTLLATSKQSIDKNNFLQFLPRDDLNLDGNGLFTLQRWLASRYYRAAFPESFETRLRAVPKVSKKSFLDQIESILEQGSEHIRGLYFELDEGKNIERVESNDCYSLGIIVLYDSRKNEPVASEAAAKVAQSLELLFSSAFNSKEQNKWLGIELLYCNEISDNALTVAYRESLREWRLEHMSLYESPAQVMVTK
jgi:hypothetical protein